MFKKSEDQEIQVLIDAILNTQCKFTKDMLLVFSNTASRLNIKMLQFGIRDFTGTIVNTRLGLSYKKLWENREVVINAKYKMICDNGDPLKECIAMHEVVIPYSPRKAMKFNLTTYATGELSGYQANETFQQLAFNLAKMVYGSESFSQLILDEADVDFVFPKTYKDLKHILSRGYNVAIKEMSSNPVEATISKMDKAATETLNDFISVDAIEAAREKKRQEYMITPFRRGVNL